MNKINKVIIAFFLLMPLSSYAADIACPSIDEINANLKSHHQEGGLDDYVYDFVDSSGNSWDGSIVHRDKAKPSDIGSPAIFDNVRIPTKQSPGISVTCYYNNTFDSKPIPGVHTKLELIKLNDRSEVPPYFKGVNLEAWGQYHRECHTDLNGCRFTPDE